MKRSRHLGSCLLLALALSGCATVERPDPLEPLNRRVFVVNDALDQGVLQPVARTYVRLVPDPVRTGVGNVFANPRDLWSAVNLFLQGRPADGLSDLMRFGTNTVFGLGGIVDVATPLGLERHGEDLGQTLGHWGMAPGAYLVLPLLGPSSLRDSVGVASDLVLAPQNPVGDVPVRNGLTLLQVADERARLLAATTLIEEIAIDRYLFVRDAFLQRRHSLVHNGNPPLDQTATP